jgi:hypothetical protein
MSPPAGGRPRPQRSADGGVRRSTSPSILERATLEERTAGICNCISATRVSLGFQCPLSGTFCRLTARKSRCCRRRTPDTLLIVPSIITTPQGTEFMPLRDHFRPPIWDHNSWEGFHGMWPASMVVQLSKILPEEFTAEPRVHLGTYFEIDVCAYESNEPAAPQLTYGSNGGGLATATWASPRADVGRGHRFHGTI